MDKSIERFVVIVCTVSTLAGVAFETGFLYTAGFAGIGILIGGGTLPWRARLYGNGDDLTYVCGWTLLWPFLLLYFLGDGLKWFYRAWGDWLSRKEYERSQKKLHKREGE